MGAYGYLVGRVYISTAGVVADADALSACCLVWVSVSFVLILSRLAVHNSMCRVHWQPARAQVEAHWMCPLPQRLCNGCLPLQLVCWGEGFREIRFLMRSELYAGWCLVGICWHDDIAWLFERLDHWASGPVCKACDLTCTGDCQTLTAGLTLDH